MMRNDNNWYSFKKDNLVTNTIRPFINETAKKNRKNMIYIILLYEKFFQYIMILLDLISKACSSLYYLANDILREIFFSQ